MEAGLYVHLAYHSACLCITTLRNSLHYARDADRLNLGLEIERYRLQVWGENMGLKPANENSAPKLPPRLDLISDILARQLDGIAALLRDADVLRERYGLVVTENKATGSERVRALLERMQRCIPRLEGHDGGGDGVGLETRRLARTTSAPLRLRWAVRDVEKFQKLLDDLSSRISQLNQLLTETQQRETEREWERFLIRLVDSVHDKQTLDLVLQTAPPTSSTRFRAECKAISADVPWSSAPSTPIQQISISEFILPDAYDSMKRFVAGKREPEGSWLFERKDFDRDIGQDDKRRLVGRLQLLVLMLAKKKTAAFRTPLAEGCINDGSHFCWWMVYRLSTSQLVPPPEPKPLSLLHLLQPKTKFQPALELRYKLASRLCTTLFELYSSSWLHKGVRSANVLFTVSSLTQMSRVLESMVLCGFDYSRQESEQSTIDRARLVADVETALYRHPRYQGDAAEGYKLAYDIYSLGLVLVEIALWKPLSSFLEGKPIGKSSASASQLAPNMTIFHEAEATMLKKRVMNRVESEFRFRVGSAYYQATKYCLELADRETAAEGDVFAAHPSLEFYDAVVVPLASLADSQGVKGVD
ncbi:hypothetical protein CDD80_4686 [Ophiocordyceps camponoti-rufipedis]|uniref:Protein kinase domain-containing protein n=1 Tax=Ophiocordyceps camponoti-rufipedis TaxID=2004952 RepID=A0A2C5Y285_9HYPO|nr:hypothetical protein CDD80_4686 [Ophiocordyceps camponoti-rufipedis]